jgi:ribonuclease HII
MFKYIIGVDEAGRGPLAGPIVAAAVLYEGKPKQKGILAQVDDSKKLSSPKREDLFRAIIKNFMWSVQMLDSQFIDKYGIQKANFLVMWDVLEEIRHKINKPTEAVVDYIGGADRYTQQADISFYKNGESRFKEIAAASIIAKVFRDHLMMELDEEFPHYEFWPVSDSSSQFFAQLLFLTEKNLVLR